MNENKPVVTYFGDLNLFNSVQNALSAGLPQEQIEWRRPFGRASKSVYVDAHFIPFQEDTLPEENCRKLIGVPILHTFWTDCCDVDQYKASIRDEIQLWLNTLKKHGISDWMVILVETPDSRKGNKLLPRTTVLDKIKSEYGGKQAERCVSLIDPFKSDSRAAESWQTLLFRFRQLLLSAYNRTLGKFEEGMRSLRERRTEPRWNFCEYFVVQEELAFVFEMLGLYNEALIQYDELDALFTQFVLNSYVSETPHWLSPFTRPFDNWSGLSLKKQNGRVKQEKIAESKVSLIEFRNYLFSRQCRMLLQLGKPGEVAQRCLPFLHNSINELKILDVESPPGTVACWVYLSCLAVLLMCEKYDETGQVEAYSLYTAGLWAYAQKKLYELGDLCGLMPNCKATSEHLHILVELSAGMQEEDETEASEEPTPLDRLKEALSSKESFEKSYLELSELAMGTYKHIGRMRSARMIGLDLAQFYMKLREPQKSSTFLCDALKTFRDEGWEPLIAQTLLNVSVCYKQMEDRERYVKTCALLACNSHISMENRNTNFDEMMETLRGLEQEVVVAVPGEDALSIKSITLRPGQQITWDSVVEAEVTLYSNFPKAVFCQSVSIALKLTKEKSAADPPTVREGVERRLSTGPHGRKSVSGRDRTTSLTDPVLEEEELGEGGPYPEVVHMVEHLEYKQDHSLSLARLTCSNTSRALKRQDSHNKFSSDSQVTRDDYSHHLLATDQVITPGENTFILKFKASETGTFNLTQLCLKTGHLEILYSSFDSHHPDTTLSFTSVSESPVLNFHKGDGDLLAGIPQDMTLAINTGSYKVEQGTIVKLTATRGMHLSTSSSSSPHQREVEVPIPKTGPFKTVSAPVCVVADLSNQKDAGSVDHTVTIHCPWTQRMEEVPLCFIPPFMSSHKLHTAHKQKFIQIIVHGLSSHTFQLKGHQLRLIAPENAAQFRLMNPPDAK